MINFLDDWMNNSAANLNTFIGITLLLFIVSTILIIIFDKKLGKSDERKHVIQLKVNQGIYISMLVCLFFIITTMNDNLAHTKQFLLFRSFALFVGGCLYLYYYIRERI